MRIAFAGTPEFANTQLQALLKNGFNIVAVYTQPDKPVGRGQHVMPSPVKTTALEHHLPIEQPTTLKSDLALERFSHYQIDVMIVAAYGLLLPKAFLEHPRYGCINVHASLLPRWRGASPIQQAILAGDATTGITLMKMDEGLDTGGILAQKSCSVTSDDTTATLHDKLASLGATLLVDKLNSIVHQPPAPQDNHLATHAPKISKEQSQCDWNQSAIDIQRQIRAFNPWPILKTLISTEIIRLWEAHVVPLSTPALPGTIVAIHDDGIVVATQQDGLLITKAQLPNKKVLPMKDILHAKQHLFAIGQRFV